MMPAPCSTPLHAEVAERAGVGRHVRLEVGRIDEFQPGDHDDHDDGDLQGHHHGVGAADSRTPTYNTAVMASTISTAGTLKIAPVRIR